MVACVETYVRISSPVVESLNGEAMGKKLKFNLKGSNLSRRCNSSINSSKKNNSTTVGSSSRSSRNHARLHRVHFKHMKAHNNRRCRTIVVARKTRSLYHSLQQLFTSGGRM